MFPAIILKYGRVEIIKCIFSIRLYNPILELICDINQFIHIYTLLNKIFAIFQVGGFKDYFFGTGCVWRICMRFNYLQ